MKYRVVPDDDRSVDLNGSHLQGYVETTFAKLEKVFGPSQGEGDKTTQNWVLEFEDGTIATIYDWKTYSTPKGRFEWHVGGFDKKAVELVEQAIQGSHEKVDNFPESTSL